MSKTKIRIDIVSDVVCPWCIVGYKRLQKALATMADKIEAELHWHPFELNPQMAEEGENLREHIMTKYGATAQDSDRNRNNLTQIGAELGFEFGFSDNMRMQNTFKAHQLIHYARLQGKETEMELRLFSAYFSEHKDINDIETLVAEAKLVGLDENESRAILSDGRYAYDVRSEEQEWVAKGVRSVPTYIINQKYAISGAQPPEAFVEILNDISAEN